MVRLVKPGAALEIPKLKASASSFPSTLHSTFYWFMLQIFSLHLGVNIQGVERRKSIHRATDQSLKFHDTQSSYQRLLTQFLKHADSLWASWLSLISVFLSQWSQSLEISHESFPIKHSLVLGWFISRNSGLKLLKVYLCLYGFYFWLKYEKGPTGRLEKDFLQGHVAIAQGTVVLSWKRVGLA